MSKHKQEDLKSQHQRAVRTLVLVELLVQDSHDLSVLMSVINNFKEYQLAQLIYSSQSKKEVEL